VAEEVGLETTRSLMVRAGEGAQNPVTARQPILVSYRRKARCFKDISIHQS
jgi:hypothetical protein